MKSLLVFAMALCAVASAAVAGPCLVPECSEIPKTILVSPDGSLPCHLRILCCEDLPINGAFVEIEFGPEADALIAWAPGQAHPVISGLTDSNGEVTFFIAGAGCVDDSRLNPLSFVAQIRIDGIVVAEPSVVNSPDAVDDQGMLPTDIGTSICENGITVVGLSDAVFHTTPIKNGLVEPCTRLTGDPSEPVTLEDAILITPYIKTGVIGSCQ